MQPRPDQHACAPVCVRSPVILPQQMAQMDTSEGGVAVEQMAAEQKAVVQVGAWLMAVVVVMQ
jgi:hypothetical protein